MVTYWKGHWDRVYAGKAPGTVSWFQPQPRTSLELIDAIGIKPDT